ncbi:hypothetical protein BDR03DRAFT_962639 [Suillus americanus]|nr:hypothetical protein BDR03DRAFT_962639 [Suillus americanus]
MGQKDSELFKALCAELGFVDTVPSSSQPQSHASDCVCKWDDGHGPCDVTVNKEEIADHLSSSHLPPSGRARMKCLWEGCELEHICRDTIIRHIRQIHLGIKPRRQS